MELRATFLALCFVSSSCFAQSATLTVSHNDPDGLVAPGQTVQVRVVIDYAGFFGNLWEIRGHLRSSGDIGSASGNAFPGVYPLLPQTLIDPGDLSGGSIESILIRSGEMSLISGFPGPPLPPWSAISLAVFQYDWTAPITPGPVQFTWTPDPAQANTLYIAPFISQTGPVAIPTTYFGASLTVVPAPATLALLAAMGVASGKVRRSRA